MWIRLIFEINLLIQQFAVQLSKGQVETCFSKKNDETLDDAFKISGKDRGICTKGGEGNFNIFDMIWKKNIGLMSD